MSFQLVRPYAGAVTILRVVGWWSLLIVCVTFGGFALWTGVVEILSQADVVHHAKERAVPEVFVIHAVAGGVALVAGVFQFNRQLRIDFRQVHRIIGRVYVGAAWAASIGGLWSAMFFAVDISARIAFGAVAILWFTATTLAFRHARQGRIAVHRDWMIRSFALALFFVTGELWVMGLESTGLPHVATYPLGILLGWLVNLIVAELWIRLSGPARESEVGPAFVQRRPLRVNN